MDRELPESEEMKITPLPEALKLPRVKAGEPAGHALLASLESALLRIQSIEIEARQGDSEGIHRLRTSIRRLRSELRALRDLVHSAWLEEAEGELKWLARLLGEIRDVDVLLGRLKSTGPLKDDFALEAISPLLAELEERHSLGMSDVREALQADRYASLLAKLQNAIEHPEFKDEAWIPCRSALPPIAVKAWHRLKSSARDLRADDPDERFHEVRKRAKRTRYTAEMIASILGHARAKRASRFVRAVTRVQDALGEYQDSTNAAREIARAIDGHPTESAFAQAGLRLLEFERAAAQDARDAYFRAWDKLDRKKLRRWMKRSSRSARRIKAK